ncbi:MAG: hypothetical protein QM642_05170, partial [Edaphocola sp.]
MKKNCFLVFCFFVLSQGLFAQTSTINTTSTFSVNNGYGIVTFNLQNTNAYPIVVTEIKGEGYIAGGSAASVWYNTTPVSGAPGIISAANGWTQVASSTFGFTSSYTLETMFSGTSLSTFVVPAGTTYGVAIYSVYQGYYTMSAGTVTFSAGGVNLLTGTNISYGGGTPGTTAPSNTPRGWVGEISFEPQVTITDNAGITSSASPLDTPFCSNIFKEISVVYKNLGANSITTDSIGWSVDGVLQPKVAMTTTLSSYFDSTTVVLGEVLFPLSPSQAVEIKAWPTLPNGVTDNDPSDDTLAFSMAAGKQGISIQISPQDTFMCSGTTLVLDADTHSSSPIYIWDNGVITQTRTIYGGGTYWVKVQTSDGCVDYDTVTIEEYANLGI